MKHFDVVVIGSGPGGYVSAIRSAQLGFSTAIVEKYDTLGGTCLNVGCIPSKALLDSSHHFSDLKHLDEHGIVISGEASLDLSKMIERKDKVVSQTCQGVNFLMSKNKIEFFCGVASFVSPTEISVELSKGGSDSISSKYFIIATGSKPVNLPFAPIDKKRIITSTEALNLKQVPKHLVVIGAGVIGLELGQVYLRLGSKVSVVEYADSVLPNMDKQISSEAQKVLKKQGMEFYTSSKVESVSSDGKKVVVKASNSGKEIVLEGDYCLVSVGRAPYTKGLELQNAGVSTDSKGFIVVNSSLQTSCPNIYAIGDVIGGAMLAHKAEDEGVFVAESLAGQKPHINYNLIPSAVYTTPEIACVGKTQQQLVEQGIEFNVGVFPFRALGRARASSQTDGFVKILSCKSTDEILGVHIIGERASDLIIQAVTAMEFRSSAEDLARICYPHPSFSEAIKEAALVATDNRPIHS